MTLDDWIESLLPVTQDTDWNTVFAEPSSPFSTESSLKLASFLKECVSISGISGYINLNGEVVSSIPWGTRDAISIKVSVNNIKTFYNKHGDYIGRISSFLSSLLIVVGFVRRKVNKN